MHKYTDAEWLAALRSAGPDRAIAALRTLLTQGLRHALRKYDVTEADVEDFAQEALLRILDALDNFRGESRFTTWAQKIAVRTALTELRRHRWRNVALSDLLPTTDQEEEALAALTTSAETSPEQQAAQRELRAMLQELMAHCLTERQRLALSAVMYHGMPLAEVARRLDTNRNALYKLLYDARSRLKNALLERGLDASELLSLFESEST